MILTRTYSVTDACDNSINVNHRIIVYDEEAPTATAPSDWVFSCEEAIPSPDINDVTNVSDNYSTPVVTFVTEYSDNNSCPEIWTPDNRTPGAPPEFRKGLPPEASGAPDQPDRDVCFQKAYTKSLLVRMTNHWSPHWALSVIKQPMGYWNDGKMG